jgi:hypothetical protein
LRQLETERVCETNRESERERERESESWPLYQACAKKAYNLPRDYLCAVDRLRRAPSTPPLRAFAAVCIAARLCLLRVALARLLLG